MQSQWVYLIASLLSSLQSMKFGVGVLFRVATVVDFVAVKAWHLNGLSTPAKFLLLNLKGIREERRVEHPGPERECRKI